MTFPATEFEFILPRGLLDEVGVAHRQGVMRLATAKDELMLERDRTAQSNPAYGDLVMLARVITQLGTLADITPTVLENLFTLDLAYLREFYNRINQQDHAYIPTQCPNCQHEYEVDLALSGEF
jgi:hypothetical protein